MPTITLCGLDLEQDEAGRVDITAVNRRAPAIYRSPSEWARTRRCRDLRHDLLRDQTVTAGDIWRIDGTKKQARTWVHPTLAQAYLEDLELGALSREDLIAAVADLQRRVGDIELQILGWGEGLE